MIVLYIFCSVTLIYRIDANPEIKDTLKNKEIEFVENLKQDLRRNNDDYAEMQRTASPVRNDTQEPTDSPNVDAVRYKILTTRGDTKLTSPKLSKITTSTTKLNENEDVRYKIIDNIRRRVNDALRSKETIDDSIPQRRAAVMTTLPGVPSVRSPSTIKPLWKEMPKIVPRPQNKFNNIPKLPHILNNKLFRLQTLTTATNMRTEKANQKPLKQKKSKLEKIQKFVAKNKDLLREFINKKKQMTLSHPTPQYNLVNQYEAHKVIKQTTSDQINLGELPDADLLDMAPARGARIQDKRQNGRLCHRHVLIPEGPKYNSAGRIYLPPYIPTRGARQYNVTRRPRLLLPRCCNCCRKSVLGCD